VRNEVETRQFSALGFFRDRRKDSAVKNLAGALHADRVGCTLSVVREVKMEIPVKIFLVGAAAIVLLPAVRIGPTAIAQSSSPPNLCFAFLRQGNIWVHCVGKTQAVTADGRVYDYAISSDASYLAMYKSMDSKQPSEGNQEVVLVALQKGFVTSTSPVHLAMPRLRSSCGTIAISQTGGNADDTYDAISGKPIRPKGEGASGGSKSDASEYGDFGCSSDRSVIAGLYKEKDISLHSVLITGWPVYLYLGPEMNVYSVSPSGRYVAYDQNDGPLCVTQVDENIGHSDCRYESRINGRLEVDNSGGLLFEGSDNRVSGCSYRDYQHYSPGPFEKSQDSCPAIWYWRPGQKGELIVEDLARNPEWISEEQASLLEEWASQSGINPSKPANPTPREF
jgi:hypothetical protein